MSKKIFVSLFGGAMLLVASPALAGPSVNDMKELTEDALDTGCAKKVAKAAKKVGPKWKRMRSKCSALRRCKKSCRKAKRGAKRDARAEKRECKQECRGKKGKAKRRCKKQCRQEFRQGKRGARQAKRNCVRECRSEYKNANCRNARRAFWGEIANSIKNSGGQCAKDAQAFFQGG